MDTKFKMQHYEAPEGKVYDYAVPQYSIIIELDGSTTKEEEHLYAKYLTLSPHDDINNYKLVKDPGAK